MKGVQFFQCLINSRLLNGTLPQAYVYFITHNVGSNSIFSRNIYTYFNDKNSRLPKNITDCQCVSFLILQHTATLFYLTNRITTSPRPFSATTRSPALTAIPFCTDQSFTHAFPYIAVNIHKLLTIIYSVAINACLRLADWPHL